jgi:hypothetical protein
MRGISISLGLGLLLVATNAAAALQPDDARAVIDRAIKAHGGADTLSKNAVHAWKAKGAMTAGGGKMEYVADYTFLAPDKLRFDLDMDAGGQKMQLTAATDGKIAWEQMGATMREMPKQKQEEFQHTAYVIYLSQLTPLLDKAYKIEPLGESKHGDQTLVGVKVSHPGRRDVSLFFDKATGLLTKTRTQAFDEFQNKEVVQENVFTGYRDANGRKVFGKMTIQRDGKDFIVEEFSEQRALDKIDANKFAKPAGGS